MLSRIETKTVVEQIVKQIIGAITSGELKPGDKIPTEVELIQSLGVGRNSIREAVKMLSAVGILEICRGDGTYINKSISSSSMDLLVYSLILEQSTKEEILELRQTIEIDILELAVMKATAEDIEKLENILARFNIAFENNDFRLAAKLDLEFHFIIADMTRNPLLSRIAKGVLQLFFSSIEKTLRGYEATKGRGHETHHQMVDIIKNRDSDRIRPIIEKSLEGWKKFI